MLPWIGGGRRRLGVEVRVKGASAWRTLAQRTSEIR